MNDQNPPNNLPSGAPGEQPEGEPQQGAPEQGEQQQGAPQHDQVPNQSPPTESHHDLQPPQPAPPVYAPPPHLGSQPPQYAPPPQQNQPWAPSQPPQQQAGPQPPQFGQPQPPQQPGQFGQQPPQFAPTGQQQPPQQPGQFAQQPYVTAQQAQPGQPYAQPQQYAPGQPQPGQPPQPGQQYAPGMPPTGAPPRKGLPVGAWIGIGAGALVLLLIIALGIALPFMLKGPATSEPAPVPPTTEVPEEEPETPAQLDLVTLDDPSEFAAGPYWAVPFEDGWDIVRFDEQGVNEFKNVATGCMFFTYQGYGPEGLTATEDRGATEETLSTALQIGLPWTAATADPEVNPDGTVEMPVDWAYSVEMSRYVAIYPTADGDRQRQILLRTFMPDNLALYAEVDCPATPEGDKAAQSVLDGISITEF